jgi:hypothetical protein
MMGVYISLTFDTSPLELMLIYSFEMNATCFQVSIQSQYGQHQ